MHVCTHASTHHITKFLFITPPQSTHPIHPHQSHQHQTNRRLSLPAFQHTHKTPTKHPRNIPTKPHPIHPTNTLPNPPPTSPSPDPIQSNRKPQTNRRLSLPAFHRPEILERASAVVVALAKSMAAGWADRCAKEVGL